MCKLENNFVGCTLDIFLCFNYIFMLQIYFFKCISSYLSLNSCFILRPQMSAREFSQWLMLVDADILFIYISCNPLSWFSLLEAPIPSSLPVLLYRSSHTQAYPCLPTLTFPYTFFSSAGAAAVEGAGTPEGAAPAAGAGSAAPTLQMRLPVLTLARAFADKPGQKGSMLTPAALMRALILTSVTITLLSCRMRAE